MHHTKPLDNNNKIVFPQVKIISVYSCGSHGGLLVNALYYRNDVRQLLVNNLDCPPHLTVIVSRCSQCHPGLYAYPLPNYCQSIKPQRYSILGIV